ncbi:TRAP transporter small permease [Pseudoroseicyclus tamaricis]|uniref:TRAP transporter small permease protein n=1 Tax=Pseudoroseicyclus tamaricis TaxID=2705421 RepID=A0A6B2K1R2_9RHOB|nr:TRAP transporter small permease [Pseudoroseicyclus tamaricis]NDV02424.1 TRAP transporter small permease [Pseudoroseicyclus tamaricis]
MERRTALVPGDLWALRAITALLLFAMMALTFVDVLGRYLFNAPVYGAAEMIQILLAATIFSGFGLVSDADSHITVDLFEAPLAKAFGRPRRIFIGLVSAAGLLLIGYELARTGQKAIETARETLVLEWPQAWLSLPGAIFCVIAAALQVNRSLRQS